MTSLSESRASSTRNPALRVRRPTRALVAIALAALGPVGCRLKNPPTPDELRPYAVPNAVVPPGWVAAPVDTAPPAESWLSSFGDQALIALVSEALVHNTDLEVAAARVDQAAGHLRLAGAPVKPTVDVSARGGIGMGGDQSGINGVLIRAGWELDLWGRVRYGKAAAGAAYAASQADLAYARQSIAAMVAKSYFTIAELRLQGRLTDSLAQASSQRLELIRVRQQVGNAGDQEVSLSRADLGGYLNRRLQLTQAEAEAKRALEVLVGRYPSATIATTATLPDSLPNVPAGLPLRILERRPDLIAANYRVAAAFYAKKQAVTAKLPAISLTGSFGAISSEVLQLADDFSNPVGSIGAALLAPIYRGGELNAQIDIRTAEQRAAVAAYGQAMLKAFQEVENALAAEQYLNQRRDIVSQLVQDRSRSVEVAQTRFAVGREDLMSGLEQRVGLYGAGTELLTVRTERIMQRINLHLSLGGSFVALPDSAAAPRVP